MGNCLGVELNVSDSSNNNSNKKVAIEDDTKVNDKYDKNDKNDKKTETKISLTSTLARDQLKILKGGDFKQLKKFTLDGLLMPAIITDVYDGDTLTIVYCHPQSLIPVKRQLRLFGCDAPELGPKLNLKAYDNDEKTASYMKELEKKAGQKVRDYVKDYLVKNTLQPQNGGGGGSLVLILFTKEEKFGRAMGNVYLLSKDSDVLITKDELLSLTSSSSSSSTKTQNRFTSLSQHLIQLNYCKVYMGEKKKLWTQKELKTILD